MFAKTLIVFLALVILICQVVDCAFTTRPSNTVVVTGNTVTLHCATDRGSSAVVWSLSTTEFIVIDCIVQPAYVTRYNVSNTTTSNCDLIILTANSSVAARYTCAETASSASAAYLTVIDSTPTCNSNASNLIPENDVASSFCNVSYTTPTGGPTANMTWSAGCTAQPPINTPPFYSSTVTVIAQRPTLQSCYCTTRFTAPPPVTGVDSSAPSYSYTCSTPSNVVNVSYCPTVTISSSPNTGFQYTTILTCSAVAYPNVATSNYTWDIIGGSGFGIPSGQTFNVTSVGNYNIRCTATNYLLGGTNRPCSGSATVTGTTIASYCPTNFTITETRSVNTFLCSADASPPVSVYQWTFNNTVIVSNERTYTVPSAVNYTITCTVTNYLYNNTGDPCSRNESISGQSQTPTNKQFSAGEIAGIVIGSVCGAAIIIGGLVVLLAPSCAANRMSCSQLCRPG